jgi:hypothetical protein
VKVYLASSWKTAESCLMLKEALETIDIRVNLFCFPGHRANNFDWSDFTQEPGEDIVSFMRKNPIVERAYKEDRGYLDNCDALIMVCPAGISAHLELGTALGQGKPTFIFGNLVNMKPEVWYMGVAGIYWTEQLGEFLEELKFLKESCDKNSNFP